MNKAAEKTDAALVDVDRRILEATIKPTITPQVIIEHARNVAGPGHSPELEILLRYLRRNPIRSKPRYVLIETQPFREWVIGLHSRRRGDPPALTEARFTDFAEAQHAIFLRRLLDLGDPDVTRIVESVAL